MTACTSIGDLVAGKPSTREEPFRPGKGLIKSKRGLKAPGVMTC